MDVFIQTNCRNLSYGVLVFVFFSLSASVSGILILYKEYVLQTMQFCTWQCVKCDFRAASTVPGLCRGAVLTPQGFVLGALACTWLDIHAQEGSLLGEVYSGVTESVHPQIKNCC